MNIKSLAVALVAASTVLISVTSGPAIADARARFNVDAVQLRAQPTSNSTLIGRGAKFQYTCVYYQAAGENINGTNVWYYNGNQSRKGWSPSNRIDFVPGSCYLEA